MLRPVVQQGFCARASGDEVEEFALGGGPFLAAEEMLMSEIVGGQGGLRGRDAVVGADDGGQCHGGAVFPPMFVL